MTPWPTTPTPSSLVPTPHQTINDPLQMSFNPPQHTYGPSYQPRTCRQPAGHTHLTPHSPTMEHNGSPATLKCCQQPQKHHIWPSNALHGFSALLHSWGDPRLWTCPQSCPNLAQSLLYSFERVAESWVDETDPFPGKGSQPHSRKPRSLMGCQLN